LSFNFDLSLSDIKAALIEPNNNLTILLTFRLISDKASLYCDTKLASKTEGSSELIPTDMPLSIIMMHGCAVHGILSDTAHLSKFHDPAKVKGGR